MQKVNWDTICLKGKVSKYFQWLSKTKEISVYVFFWDLDAEWQINLFTVFLLQNINTARLLWRLNRHKGQYRPVVTNFRLISRLIGAEFKRWCKILAEKTQIASRWRCKNLTRSMLLWFNKDGFKYIVS